MKTRKEIEERYRALLLQAREIADTAVKESREMTDDEREKLTPMMKEIGDLKDRLEKFKADDQFRDQLKAMGADLSLDDKAGGIQLPTQKQAQQLNKGSIGHQFANAPDFTAWKKGVAPGGQVPEKGRVGVAPAVEMNGLLNYAMGRKELITGTDPTSAGAFITPDDTGIYEPTGWFPKTVRDLVSVRQTDSDRVEFVRQTRQIAEAEPVPEANVKYPTGYPGEVDGTKPQGRMNFERVAEPVKTIAVYVGVTKRALWDASQLRGIIDQELRESLWDELETQIFTGNGVGENFLGVENQPGTLAQAFDTDILTTARRAITVLRGFGRQQPTAWVFHPTDWENIELTQDVIGRYYHNGPLSQGPLRLWGVPVVESWYITAGTAWLANWRKAVIWDRMQATITATDSHDDWFVRNLVAILAELRAAFGLIRPSAFVSVALS